jgi:lysophospholipase L1-like esterase
MGLALVIPAGATIHIMPLGDSITEGFTSAGYIPGGYRLPLYQAMTNGGYDMDFVGTLTVNPAPALPYPHHEGHGGYKIADISNGFLGWVNSIPNKPDVILLDIGTNDFNTDGTDSGNVTNQLDGLISLIVTNLPQAKVIVCNLIIKTGAYSTANTSIQTRFNPFIPGIVAKHAAIGQKVYFLDMYSALGASDLQDGVHPNQGGYNKMGARWYSGFIQMPSSPTLFVQPRLAIKFAADQDQGADVIDGSYGAGILNTTNWFNLAGHTGGSNGVSNVPFYSVNGYSIGSVAVLAYNYAAEANTINTAVGALTNNVALLNSCIVPASNGWYFSVTNLDPVFTNGYDVVFYFQGSSVGCGGQNYIRYYAGRTTNTAVLGTRQWNLFTTGTSNTGGFTQDLTPANTSAVGETAGANYFVFTNLSGGAFDLLITNGNNGGVSALEIVAHTPPGVSGPVVTPATNVYQGTTVSLTCSPYGGVAPFSMQWQVGTDGIDWTNVIGATTTNLILPKFAVGNNGYYQMIYAAGPLSTTSSVVELTLYATLPTIGATSILPSNTVIQGATVILNCTTNGGAAPFNLQWQTSGNGIDFTNLAGATNVPLTLNGVTTNNSGYYRCVFTAASISVTNASALLSVRSLFISPATVLPSNPVFSGQTAILMCSIFKGLGSYNFQWQSGADGNSWTNVPGAATNRMVLFGVTTNNAEYYQCVFTAANGSVTSAPVQLGVLTVSAGLMPTASSLVASTNNVPPNGTITFSSTVSPVPPDGEYVIFLDSSTVLGLGALGSGTATFNLAGFSKGTHLITAVYGGDGSYLASTSSVATVIVAVQPTLSPAVAMPPTNLYAGMNVTLLCSLYAGTTPYSFQWQTSGDGVVYTNVPGATDSQVSLTGVTTNNSGYYQLVFNAGGLSVKSSAVRLTISPLPMIAVGATYGKVVLSWSAGALLQATNLAGPWVTNYATSPYTNVIMDPQRYFRLQL